MVVQTRALGRVGLDVVGFDFEGDVDAGDAASLRQAWRDAGVLLFRGGGVSPERLLKLSRLFGEPEPHPIPDLRLPSHPDLILLTNKGGLRGPVYAFDGTPTYGRIPWHTDLAFSTKPNAGALLNMVERVACGGRTAWLDTALAYEAMDSTLKRRLEGVEARFEFCADLSAMRFLNPGGERVGASSSSFPDYPPIARPLVWRHPNTGRTILNVCPLNLRGIVGMDQAEGDALIEALIDAVIKPEFIYEHDWVQGDIVLWDNYRMMHSAAGHPVEVIRVAHRTTLRGHAVTGRVLDEKGVRAA